jgi:NADH-quinone oxidoreductase subunit E
VIDRREVDDVLKQYGYKVEHLLPILIDVQETCTGKYIDSELSRYLADAIKIPYSQLSEVLTFFAAINKEPKGKYHIEMCNSTVCRVNDNHLLEQYLIDSLYIGIGETTADKLFSLDYAPCFGACDIAPSIRINKRAYGHLTIDKLKQIIENLRGTL